MNVMMVSLLLYTKAVEASAVPVFRWVMLGLAAPAMAVLAYPFALGAAAEARRGTASLDTLIGRCGWPAPALAAHLLTLELDGWVARLPGGLYQRRHRG